MMLPVQISVKTEVVGVAVIQETSSLKSRSGNHCGHDTRRVSRARQPPVL